MSYRIEHFESGVLGAIFSGVVDMGIRLQALDALEQSIEKKSPSGLLIDLAHAGLSPYSATDALKLVHRINARDRPLKAAYVVRAHQSDIVATIMSCLHGDNRFRRFEDWSLALAWLKNIN